MQEDLNFETLSLGNDSLKWSVSNSSNNNLILWTLSKNISSPPFLEWGPNLL